MPLSRLFESRHLGRGPSPVAPAHRVVKRRIVLHVLRAPHGQIAIPVDETSGCAHRQTS